MGTVADKLNKVLSTKEAIKAAIIEKGQTVEDADIFASYPDKIRAIETGSKIGRIAVEDCEDIISISSTGKLTLRFPSEIQSAAKVINMYCVFRNTSVSTGAVAIFYSRAFGTDTGIAIEILVPGKNYTDIMFLVDTNMDSTNSIETMSSNSDLKPFAGNDLSIMAGFIFYEE